MHETLSTMTAGRVFFILQTGSCLFAFLGNLDDISKVQKRVSLPFFISNNFIKETIRNFFQF